MLNSGAGAHSVRSLLEKLVSVSLDANRSGAVESPAVAAERRLRREDLHSVFCGVPNLAGRVAPQLRV